MCGFLRAFRSDPLYSIVYHFVLLDSQVLLVVIGIDDESASDDEVPELLVFPVDTPT